MSRPRYVLGIDLGTTNSALAFTEIHPAESQIEVEAMLIPQLANPAEVRDEPLLPSSLYIPGSNDFPAGSLALPWAAEPEFVVGALARKRGSENAGRLVSSAKSWLSHAGVDRTSALLPAAAPEGVRKISPVDASAQYLLHLHNAWNNGFGEAPLVEQEVYVTVPASFDAVARELTLRAAESAGYRAVTLLEEPQAAFYAWIERHADWRERIGVGDLVLVIDIGGGTTDFTLIAVKEERGEVALERVAVGEHILLGGDNVDLALARAVAARLPRIDTFQLQTLWNLCRAGKEKLLDPASTDTEFPVTLLGKGSGLVGGSIKASLRLEDVQQTLESFFPAVSSHDLPERQKRSALQEIGLPYATDAAVTRHLARFLRQQSGGFAAPTHVLFNGGVLHAPFVRDRLLQVLNSWLREEGKPNIQLLSGEDLMQAVARGAAYYGAARQGKGVRIRGGISRSYYVGVESSLPAVPGFAAPLKALTVASFGMEEGTDLRIPGREFGLFVGEPAEFRLFSSTTRRDDAPGAVLEETGPELEELPPMEVHFAGQEGAAHELVRVTFETIVTETGMLQLWCVAPDGRRWKLEFNVRERVSA